MSSRPVLSRTEVRAVYDRVGARQDTQSVYEAPALDAIVAHGGFDDAHALFEVGCGTGRFVARLLRNHCPPSARYTGVDLSATMVAHARTALAPFAHRATVVHTDGTLRVDRPDGAYDRIIAAYVLDLLSDADVETFLDEAHRLLAPGGRLCVAGLTWGRGLSRLSALLWDAVHACAPTLVGGCRPMNVRSRLNPARWHVRHATTVTGLGIPSEVLVAEARGV
jgi:SAM-dependent methyltransferase